MSHYTIVVFLLSWPWLYLWVEESMALRQAIADREIHLLLLTSPKESP